MMQRPLLLIAALAGGLLLQSGLARADLRVCNLTSSKVGLAIGYREGQEWLTEGWINIKPNSCEPVLKGLLNHRYYYIHAVDYDRGGGWAGRSFLCTSEREFTVRGAENCLARGLDRTGFLEVDTGEQKQWTVQLSDVGRQPVPPQ
jgi:uncharacterized membrane protein